jgi:hypothetical protein
MQTFFFGNDPRKRKPEQMKNTTVIYYGEADVDEAVSIVASERAAQNVAVSRDASAFDGEAETCTDLIILGSVTTHARKKIEAAYVGVRPTVRTISGPKAKPEEISQAARPDANLIPAATMQADPPRLPIDSGDDSTEVRPRRPRKPSV